LEKRRLKGLGCDEGAVGVVDSWCELIDRQRATEDTVFMNNDKIYKELPSSA
jgi:hypothetical protein